MRNFIVVAALAVAIGCRDAATEDRIKRLEDRVSALERHGTASVGAPAVSRDSAIRTGAPLPVASVPPPRVESSSVPGNDPASAEPVLVAHCNAKWPTDFEMRAYCQKQQREGVAKLNAPPPADVPKDVFGVVRTNCAVKWPDDYEMREYCETQQFSGYREARR